MVGELQQRWGLTIGAPFEQGVTGAWVAPVYRTDGTAAVWKLGMPHMEGADEMRGLRYVPGSSLRELAEPEQDMVTAGLFRRMWREPTAAGPRDEWNDRALLAFAKAISG